MSNELVQMKTANVINQKNWIVTVDTNELKEINTERRSSRHQPVNHGTALEMFRQTLNNKNLSFDHENGMMSKDNMKYIYVADVVSNRLPDLTFTVGFINYNNGFKSFTGICGERVFVCSNEMVSCQIQESRRKHTTRVFEVLQDKMNNVADHFERFVEVRLNQINHLKQYEIDDVFVGKMCLAMFRQKNLTIGNTDISRIVAEYDTPSHVEFQGRNAWNFQQACTEVAKGITDPVRRVQFTNFVNNKMVEFTTV